MVLDWEIGIMEPRRFLLLKVVRECPGNGNPLPTQSKPVLHLLELSNQVPKSGKAARPLLLFGSADPDQYERLPERRYVGSIHTLALVCDDEELRRRLTSRPGWRGWGTEDFVVSMLRFNRSLRVLAERQPELITLLDTTHDTSDVSAAHVATWATKLLERER
jgi:hypothetical protein